MSGLFDMDATRSNRRGTISAPMEGRRSNNAWNERVSMCEGYYNTQVYGFACTYICLYIYIAHNN